MNVALRLFEIGALAGASVMAEVLDEFDDAVKLEFPPPLMEAVNTVLAAPAHTAYVEGETENVSARAGATQTKESANAKPIIRLPR